MTDQPTTPSGSRWEHDPDAASTPGTPATPADETAPESLPDAAPSPLAHEPGPDGTAPEERRAERRRRAGLAGAATALALGAGVTGFAIGHSTAAGGPDRLSPANFSGQVPGGGQLGEGQQGPPGYGDRDGDHAWGHDGGGGLGQQPPGTSGSSGSSSSNGSGTSANPT